VRQTGLTGLTEKRESLASKKTGWRPPTRRLPAQRGAVSSIWGKVARSPAGASHAPMGVGPGYRPIELLSLPALGKLDDREIVSASH
jgi:hypothetical protein